MFRARALTALFWVGCLLGGTNALAQDDEPLPPQKVFVYTTAADAQKVYLRFAVLDGYYLYRARFGFASATKQRDTARCRVSKGRDTHRRVLRLARDLSRQVRDRDSLSANRVRPTRSR